MLSAATVCYGSVPTVSILYCVFVRLLAHNRHEIWEERDKYLSFAMTGHTYTLKKAKYCLKQLHMVEYY